MLDNMVRPGSMALRRHKRLHPLYSALFSWWFSIPCSVYKIDLWILFLLRGVHPRHNSWEKRCKKGSFFFRFLRVFLISRRSKWLGSVIVSEQKRVKRPGKLILYMINRYQLYVIMSLRSCDDFVRLCLIWAYHPHRNRKAVCFQASRN